MSTVLSDISPGLTHCHVVLKECTGCLGGGMSIAFIWSDQIASEAPSGALNLHQNKNIPWWKYSNSHRGKQWQPQHLENTFGVISCNLLANNATAMNIHSVNVKFMPIPTSGVFIINHFPLLKDVSALLFRITSQWLRLQALTLPDSWSNLQWIHSERGRAHSLR